MFEREEGLFTRHGATRLLCVLGVAGAFTAALMLGGLVWIVLTGDGSLLRLLFSRPFVLFGVLVLVWAPGTILWLWRKCDRCGRRLFSEGQTNHIYLSAPQERAWSEKTWWARWSGTSERDYRAKTLLGSYRNAAMVSMAVSGSLNCQWCGHEDGAPPSYVSNR